MRNSNKEQNEAYCFLLLPGQFQNFVLVAHSPLFPPRQCKN